MGEVDLRRLAPRGYVSSPFRNGIACCPFSVLLFQIAAVASISIPIVREIGGAYEYATPWEFTRFSFQTSTGGVATLLNMVQLTSFVALLFRAVFLRKNSHPLLSIAAFGSFIISGIIESFGYQNDLLSIITGNVSIALLLIPLFILLGDDDDLVLATRRVLLSLTTLGITCSLLFAFKFQLTCGFGSTVGWCPSRDLMAYSACLLWASVSIYDENDFPYKKRIVLCCVLALTALLLSVRSWVIQASALAIYCSISSNDAHAGNKLRRLVLIAGMGLIASMLVIQLMPDVFGTFFDRLLEDTRTGQYEAFFQQVDPKDLIFGSGAFAGYVYGANQNYLYFDNQLLYLSFHFGIVPVLCLVWVLIRVVAGGRTFYVEGNGSRRFCAMMYALALCGLSTYCSYEINVGIVILFLSFGSENIWQRKTLNDSARQHVA